MESLEYSVIGAICIDQRIVDKIAPVLSTEDFQIAACAEVYEAAVEAGSRGKMFDAVIAADILKKKHGDAAEAFIVSCMDVTPTVHNAELHAKMVHEQAAGKRLRLALIEAIDADDNPQEVAGTISGICQEFLKSETGGRVKTLCDALVTMYNGQGKTQLRLDTGFPKLDGILKGIWGGNLLIIGARPGVGKSAFALDIAETVARMGNKVLIYSMEMLADELAERLVAKRSGIDMDKLIDNDITADEQKKIATASASLSKLPIYINDEPNITTARIRAQARMFSDLKLIVVDFISLMRSNDKHDNRNLELGAISRDLKNLASELKIPIVVLAQLNRGTDETEQPGLRSLRDSGELEQNANKVVLLWNIDKDNGEIGVNVAKNRRGKTGTVKMRFDGAHMRYTEMIEDYIPPKRKRYSALED